MLGVYKEVVERHLCLPVIAGRKSDAEKFAGAVATYCIEAMMQDKKALQAGTSHFLGQNFGKAFDVQFQSRDGQARVRLGDELGHLDAAHRRGDHDPLRRQGPRPAAEPRARAGCHRPDTQERDQGRRCLPTARSSWASSRRRGCARSWTTTTQEPRAGSSPSTR